MNGKKSKTAALYDGNLQMFREPVHEPDLAVLRFMRWLAEQGRLEHQIASDPAGEYAGQVE
jgi:hypothetical protein